MLVVEFSHLARIEAPAKPCKNNQESVSADRDDGGGVGGGGGAASGEVALARRKIKDWLVLGGGYHNSKENSNKCWCSR